MVFGKKRFGTIPTVSVSAPEPRIADQVLPLAENISLIDQKYMFPFSNVIERYIKERFGEEEYVKWDSLNYNKFTGWNPNFKGWKPHLTLTNIFHHSNLNPVFCTEGKAKFYSYQEQEGSFGKYSLFDGTLLVETDSSRNNKDIIDACREITSTFWNGAYQHACNNIEVVEEDRSGLEVLSNINLYIPSRTEINSLVGYQYKFALETFSNSNDDLLRFFAFLKGGNFVLTQSNSPSPQIVSALICKDKHKPVLR